MSSTKAVSAKRSDATTAARANDNVNKTKTARSVSYKSRKRQACSQGDSRGKAVQGIVSTSHANSRIEDPIIIADDESSPERAAAMPHKKQRTSKRDEEVETLHRKLPTHVDSFIQVKELFPVPNANLF